MKNIYLLVLVLGVLVSACELPDNMRSEVRNCCPCRGSVFQCTQGWIKASRPHEPERECFPTDVPVFLNDAVYRTLSVHSR